ncbi:thyrotroph embryonic factor isoform X2 [Apis florea]|uniref:thyrotroph embryonic factor isoform X2 n=2 Tax=Apis florea TaxID=7463 RepID=UPI000629684F|nr:thyrotroph embryonic factor isoform X2 [Apis florea]
MDVPLHGLYMVRCGRSRCKYVDPFICRQTTTTGKIANNGLVLHHRNVGYVAKRAKICILERRRYLKMESFSMPSMNNIKTEFNSEELNTEAFFADAILDLSFKKRRTSTSSQPNSLDSYLNSPASSTKQDQTNHISESETERNSPFEVRTFMVTPPSESNSPTKIKYELIYDRTDMSENNNKSQNSDFSNLSTNIPIPTMLSTFLNQNGGTVKQTDISNTSALSLTTSTTCSSEIGLSNTSDKESKKAARPFKAYPKDPLSLTVGTVEMIYDQNSNEAYSEFRKRMLESVKKSNEGTNVKMRRVTKSPGLPTSTVDEKDAAYWERRRRNNEAAKRSRDARRAKEDEIAIRAAFLEQENIKLKYELVALRNETAKLRCMVYST